MLLVTFPSVWIPIFPCSLSDAGLSSQYQQRSRHSPWVDLMSGDFIDRALPLDRLQSDLHLEGGGVRFSLLLFHRITMIG